MIRNKDFAGFIIIFLMSLISLTWFRGKLINMVDFDYSITPWLDFQKFSYVWIENDLGRFDRSPPKFIFQILQVILYKLGFNILIIEKLLFWFLVFSSGISMYLLIRYLLKYRKLSVASSILGANLYMFNMYILQVKWSNGYILSLFTYAILPLIFLYFIKYIQTRYWRYLAIIGVLSFIAIPSANNPAHYFPIFGLITLYFIYHTFVNIFTRRKNIGTNLKVFSYVAIILLLINSLWILPIFVNISEISEQVKSDDLGAQIRVGSAKDFCDIFRFLGFWVLKGKFKGEPYYPYGELYYSPLFIMLGFLIAILALLSLTTNINKQITIFLGLTLCMSIFLMKGVNPPLQDINIWLYNNIPGFWAFRQPYEKFGIFFVFSMSILLAFGVQSLLEQLSRTKMTRKTKRIVILLTTILIFMVVNIYSWPFWTGDVFPEYNKGSILKSARILIPEYYEKAGEWLNNDTRVYRTIGLPSGFRPSWVPYDWGYLGVDPLYHYIRGSYFIPSDFNEFGFLQKLEKTSNFTCLLYKVAPIINLKYIILRTDVDYNFYDWYSNPMEIKRKLDLCNELEFLKAFDRLYIYEIKNEYFLPRIYPAIKSILVDGGMTEMLQTVTSDKFKITNDIIFLSNQTDKEQWQFLKKYNNSILINKKYINVIIYDGHKRPFNWNTIPNNSIEARYYYGWKPVVVIGSNHVYDVLSFPSLKDCPYKFPPCSPKGWSAHNSTLIFIKTGHEPLVITKIEENGKPVKDIIGIWWETGWIGMGTKPIEFSVIIPPHQKAIIQIGHIIKGNITICSLDLTNLTKLNEINTTSIPTITFKEVNPTKYIVSVENATQPFFLVFSESYHPLWKIYIEDKPTEFNKIVAKYPKLHVREAKHDWYKFTPEDMVFLFKKPAVNETYHFKANGYANAWYIDPKKFDKDDDGKFTIIIYFLPQSLFYLGLFISGVTVLCCIAYLIYDWRKEKGDKWAKKLESKLKNIFKIGG